MTDRDATRDHQKNNRSTAYHRCEIRQAIDVEAAIFGAGSICLFLAYSQY